MEFREPEIVQSRAAEKKVLIKAVNQVVITAVNQCNFRPQENLKASFSPAFSPVVFLQIPGNLCFQDNGDKARKYDSQ